MWFIYFVYAWISLAILTFFLLLFVTAPFGRHTKTSWGPMINNRWAWFIMEIPSPLAFSLCFFLLGGNSSSVAYLLWSLWLFHYINRSIIYPIRQRDNKKKMPLVVTFSAIFFNVVNGFMNGYAFSMVQYDISWWFSPFFIIGAILFTVGMVINWQSDHILLHLRQPGETHYRIPYGGFFRWVSCPNLMGETIEWIGFALMASHLGAWAFAIWTAANLLPRAWKHHQWYLKKFEDYPKQRKAVIPFVW